MLRRSERRSPAPGDPEYLGCGFFFVKMVVQPAVGAREDDGMVCIEQLAKPRLIDMRHRDIPLPELAATVRPGVDTG